MKIFYVLLILSVLGGRVMAGELSLPAPDSIPSYPMFVAEQYTTNLVFSSPIYNVDIGSGDVLARKMGKTGNVLLLKADHSGIAATNVTVFLTDGQIYSFLVRYTDSMKTWTYRIGATGSLSEYAAILVSRPARLHRSARSGKIRLRLKGLYWKDGLLWVSTQVKNHSPMDFTPDLLRFSIEESRHLRRSAAQSLGLDPIYSSAPGVVPGGGCYDFASALHPVIFGKGKRLLLEWADSGSGQRIELRIKSKDVLKAQKLN